MSSNLSGRRRKTFLFLKEGRFRRSRSSKVDEFGANRKRVSDFLLFSNNPISYLASFRRFRSFYVLLTPSLFNRNFGVFPLHQITHGGVSERKILKLFGCEIIFEEFQPMLSRYLNVTDRQTDGRHAIS